jgi:hypothetical protein
MIHYHGLPITPASAACAAIGGGHAFISHRYPEQLGLVLDVCQSFAVDNGAFSAWKSGKPITDWREYYDWVAEFNRYGAYDFGVIPDVIDGGEDDNDALLKEWPWQDNKNKGVGAPVWHMHESLDRLERMAFEWPRICLGSSGEYATVGNNAWWTRMAEAMNVVCDKHGRPVTKLHGLRMLNPDVFSRLPLASADSTNIAQNIGIDKAWRGTYTPSSKDVRAMVMRERIESVNSATFWAQQETQMKLIIAE